jgi:calcium-dependent protein kinase
MKELNATFESFDKNHDGKLSREELLDGYTEIFGLEAATEETEQVMQNVDTDGSGYIDYSEFVAASMNKKKLLSKNNLTQAFACFDADGSGTITVDEVKAFLGGFTNASDDVWREILQEVDADGNGILDIKEFKEMMLRMF